MLYEVITDMPVYAAEQLKEDDEIAFNAGSHTELIRMSYLDFEKLVWSCPTRWGPGSRTLRRG